MIRIIFLNIIFMISTFSSKSQEQTIRYKNWNGSISQLVDFDKKDTRLILKIILPETQDTVHLFLSPLTPEVKRLYDYLVSFSNFKERYVMKTEEQGLDSFVTKIRAPYQQDTSMMATYYEYFPEEKLFLKNAP